MDRPYKPKLNNLNSILVATEVRSLTQGKGEFAMEYLKYLPVRPEAALKLVNEYQKVNERQNPNTKKQKKKN
jgi:elongation factor G